VGKDSVQTSNWAKLERKNIVGLQPQYLNFRQPLLNDFIDIFVKNKVNLLTFNSTYTNRKNDAKPFKQRIWDSPRRSNNSGGICWKIQFFLPPEAVVKIPGLMLTMCIAGIALYTGAQLGKCLYSFTGIQGWYHLFNTYCASFCCSSFRCTNYFCANW